MVTVNLNLNTNSTATTDFETMANNLFRDGTAQQIQAALSSGLSALCSDSDLSSTSSHTCSTAPSSRRSSNQSNRSSNFEPTTTKQQPRPRRASLLSFGRVEVIEVDQILGDNPAANGPPISAGWNVLSRRTIELDTFDAQRQVDRRTRSELLLSRRERHSRLLRSGIPARDLRAASARGARVRYERRESEQDPDSDDDEDTEGNDMASCCTTDDEDSIYGGLDDQVNNNDSRNNITTTALLEVAMAGLTEESAPMMIPMDLGGSHDEQQHQVQHQQRQPSRFDRMSFPSPPVQPLKMPARAA